MQNRILLLIAFACVFVFCISQKEACSETDPRRQVITQSEVKQIAVSVPLESPQHFYVLSRASLTGISTARCAYEQYKALLNKKSDSATATLLSASATLRYYEKLSDTRRKGSQENYQPLLKEADTLFRRAMFLDPNSARINKHYGDYMYRYDYNQGQQIGLVALQRAENIDPKDAGVHAILGNIYANPFGKTYDPKKSETELLKAIALDPTYAYPHDRIMGLYLWLKQPAKVREHLAIYRKLLPNPEKSDKYLNGILAQCEKMEKAQSAVVKEKP